MLMFISITNNLFHSAVGICSQPHIILHHFGLWTGGELCVRGADLCPRSVIVVVVVVGAKRFSVRAHRLCPKYGIHILEFCRQLTGLDAPNSALPSPAKKISNRRFRSSTH